MQAHQGLPGPVDPLGLLGLQLQGQHPRKFHIYFTGFIAPMGFTSP